MALPALLLLAATRESRITALDWLTIALYFGILLGVATWVVRPRQGLRHRLLPRRPQPGLVGHRRIHLRLQHRLGTHRRTGRLRRHQRRRHGAL
jgi:hypothetical protein